MKLLVTKGSEQHNVAKITKVTLVHTTSKLKIKSSANEGRRMPLSILCYLQLEEGYGGFTYSV